MHNKYLIWITIFFTLIAILTRYEIATSHFTSWDDLFPGYVQMTIAELNRDELLNFIEKSNSNLITYIKIFPTFLLKLLAAPIYIAKTGISFAPLPYFLNPFLIFSLINFEPTYYSELLFIARFQSFLFSILFFILFFYLIIKKVKNYSEKICLISIGGTIFLTSWPFLTLSGHGSNYANLLFCIVALVLNMFFLMNAKNSKSFIISGFTWILLVLMNYQVVFFLPGALLTLFILKKDKNKKNLIDFSYLSISILISLVIIIFFLSLNRVEVNTNFISTNGAEETLTYLFFNKNYFDFYGFVIFIFSNLTKVTYSVLAMGNIPENYHDTFTTIVYILSILGALNLFKNNKLFFYFTVFSISTFLILMFFSILAFSPTRHMIWLLFFLGILISYSFNFFLELTKHKKKIFILIFICSIINMVFFISDYSLIKKDREDPLMNINIKEIIHNNDINLIATYRLSYNLHLHPNIKKNFTQIHNQGGIIILSKKNVKLKSNNVNLLLYCSNGSFCFNQIDDQISSVKEKLKKIINLDLGDLSYKKIESKNIITTTSETFGSFTTNNLKTQVFQIYRSY